MLWKNRNSARYEVVGTPVGKLIEDMEMLIRDEFCNNPILQKRSVMDESWLKEFKIVLMQLLVGCFEMEEARFGKIQAQF